MARKRATNDGKTPSFHGNCGHREGARPRGTPRQRTHGLRPNGRQPPPPRPPQPRGLSPQSLTPRRREPRGPPASAPRRGGEGGRPGRAPAAGHRRSPRPVPGGEAPSAPAGRRRRCLPRWLEARRAASPPRPPHTHPGPVPPRSAGRRGGAPARRS